MWIPDWLYERLPLVYLFAGGACLWTLGLSQGALLSATLLLAAAWLTRTWRRRCRQAQTQTARDRLVRR